MESLQIGTWIASMGEGSKGFFVDADGFDGWDDGVDYRLSEVEIPQAPGSFDLPTFAGSRRISASGLCHADSDYLLGWYKSQLTGVLADGLAGKVQVEYQGVNSWAMAHRVGSKFKTIVPGTLAQWQLQVWCPDPRKFGDPHTFAGGIPASHHGNFIAAPVLTISGDSPSGYTIYGPDGKQFVVTIPLVSGHPHTIDMATGYVTVDGVIVTGAVAQADTWGIPGGAQVTMTVSAGTLSALVVDTYV